MALNNFKCNHLMPLHFKGLMGSAVKGLIHEVNELDSRQSAKHG